MENKISSRNLNKDWSRSTANLLLPVRVYKSMEEVLKQIRDFADQAHGEQMRKYTPERYIVHPVRVMEMCKNYTQDMAMLAAALLHDVLEDTPVTKEQIEAFLQTLMSKEEAQRTVSLVEELTDKYVKSSYPEWNRRKRKTKETERLEQISPKAQTIKYADVIDNSVEIVVHDPSFARVFLHEYRALLKKMNKGHQQLYQKAAETVEACIAQLKNKQADETNQTQ